MLQEIENLITIALADGEVTEKERAIILRKAEALGADKEEVEMILDGKIHQMNAAIPQPSKEKKGNIKTCPNCGASCKATKLSCEQCDHEFINASSNNNLKELEKKLADAKKASKRIQIITNHPIPNTKEDLIEMCTFFSGKVLSSLGQSSTIIQDDTEITRAYHGRALELINKLRIMANEDVDLTEKLDLIETKMKKTIFKQKSSFILDFWGRMLFGIAFCYFTYAFIAKLFGYHFWPFN